MFPGRHARKEAYGLKGPAYPQPGNAIRLQWGQIHIVQKDRTTGAGIDTGDQVKNGGLSRPIRPYKTIDIAFGDLQAEIIDGRKSPKFLVGPFQGEKWGVFQGFLLFRYGIQKSIRSISRVTMPEGLAIMSPIITTPKKAPRQSCKNRRNSGSRVKMLAPNTGPQ